MSTSRWILTSWLLPLVVASALSAQEGAGPVASAATRAPASASALEAPASTDTSPLVETVAAGDPTPAPPSAEESSRILKENLQATIDEGERVLKALPQERLRILRTRLSNLERQLKKKERERGELNDSLANLRADYFRRLAALRGDEKQTSAEGKAEELKLKSDYDLHAEFFEDEVKALNRDLVEIRETTRELRAKVEIEERMQPDPNLADREPMPSDRVDGLPKALDPFEFKSYMPLVRGRDTAPRANLLALRAEVAYRQGQVLRAAAALDEVLERPTLSRELRAMSAYNRAYMEYLGGNYPRAYGVFRDHFADDLTAENSHVLAVLAYMNGFMGDTRAYLQETDAERRQKMEVVLGPISRTSAITTR